MFAEYNRTTVSSTQSQARERDEEKDKEDPCCLCCKVSHVLVTCNGITLLLSIAFLYVGALFNNYYGWGDLSGTNVLGNLCLGLGAFIMSVSILGIAAAVTKLRTVSFVYLLLLMLMSALLTLTLTYISVEADNVEAFLEQNWEAVQKALGSDVTMDEAEATFFDYFLVIVSVGSIVLTLLLLNLICAVRQLGFRFIALAQLVALGLIGAGTIVGAFFTRRHVPTATAWLLYGCGAVQLLCSLCGLVGFGKKNRECIFWLFVILLASTGGLVYVDVVTYTEIDSKLNQGKASDDLLVVFAVATMAIIFNASTLIFEALYYCRLRQAFKEADKAAQLPVHFSSNHQRHRSGKKRRGTGGAASAAHEYNPRNAL